MKRTPKLSTSTDQGMLIFLLTGQWVHFDSCGARPPFCQDIDSGAMLLSSALVYACDTFGDESKDQDLSNDRNPRPGAGFINPLESDDGAMGSARRRATCLSRPCSQGWAASLIRKSQRISENDRPMAGRLLFKEERLVRELEGASLAIHSKAPLVSFGQSV